MRKNYKKVLCLLLFSIVVIGFMSAQYVVNQEIGYILNLSAQQFQSFVEDMQPGGVYRDNFGNPFRPVNPNKIGHHIVKALDDALGNHNLDVGDIFIFGCGDSSWVTTHILLRITSVKGGSFNYTFYAFQRSG